MLNFYKKTIFLTVEDFGKGYDEKLDSKEDGGFGLSIARKLVDVFEIEKGTLLTPSAKQFLNEKGIELVIKGEKPLVSTKNEENNVDTEEKVPYEKPKYL